MVEVAEVLGDRGMLVAMSFVLPQGEALLERDITLLVDDIITSIGVTPVHAHTVYRYPVEGDKGGVGFTYIQPFVESFIAVDYWEPCGGAYLVIFSCKPFWLPDVMSCIRKRGFKIMHTVHQDLWLTDEFLQ